MQKENFNYFETIKNLLSTFPILYANLKKLFFSEAKLACKSMGYIFILVFVAGFLFVSTWVSLNGIVAAICWHYNFSMLATSGMLLLLHFAAFGLIAIRVASLKKYFSFLATRQQINALRDM